MEHETKTCEALVGLCLLPLLLLGAVTGMGHLPVEKKQASFPWWAVVWGMLSVWFVTFVVSMRIVGLM